jgi:hypothetical protein
MASTLKQLVSSQQTLLNTGATLTNNSQAISSAFDNTQGGTGDGYTKGRLTLSGTFGTAPAANTGLSIWFLTSEDGTTYEDGDASTTPSRPPDYVIPVRAVNTAQLIAKECLLPAAKFKVLARNDGTGQTLNSGWTLKVLPITSQLV